MTATRSLACPLAVCFALCAASAAAQAFETVSIRPAHMSAGCFSMAPPGGTQYAVTCATLRLLVSFAYSPSEIEGKQSALDNAYDVRASTPNGQPWTTDTVRPMLRQLLAERFHLQTHAGKREVSGYGLTVAKGGSQLHAIAAEEVPQGIAAGVPARNSYYPGHISSSGGTMATVAALLTLAAGAPVIDHTRLPGTFTLDLRYAPNDDPNPTLSSLPSAVEEQLGLKLKAERVTLDTLVVDAVDAGPTSN